MRVLVTGASGFIGSHLGRELQDAGHLVVGIDLEVDASIEGAIESHQAEVLIHLEDGVQGLLGESAVYKTVSDTAGITALIAKTCGERGVRFIYASTEEIYGDCSQQVSSEEGPFGLPGTTYALGKLMGESLGLLYAPIGLTVLRISAPYGPGVSPSHSEIANLLSLAQRGEEVPAYPMERSWCWVGDTVRAIRVVMEKGTGVYNIGRDDNPTTLQEVAEIACALTGAGKDLIKMVPAPERHVPVRRLSTRKLQLLGWEPRVSLYEGMGMSLDSLVEQPELVDSK